MQFVPVYIGLTKRKGRGVFASEPIRADVIIESAPVLVMTAEDRKILDLTLLHDYIFEWQPGGENLCCMALGWIPIYNHSYHANCEYFMDYGEDTMYIQAVRNIGPGEEITINYNGDWNDQKKVWFDAKD